MRDHSPINTDASILMHGLMLMMRGEDHPVQRHRPIPPRLRGVDIKAEYALIQEKKSKLPSITRGMVVWVYEREIKENRKGE